MEHDAHHAAIAAELQDLRDDLALVAGYLAMLINRVEWDHPDDPPLAQQFVDALQRRNLSRLTDVLIAEAFLPERDAIDDAA